MRRAETGGFAIETDGLVKAFKATRALDGFSMQVPHGMIYGLLGPNGAGKTTAVRVLATLLRPDGGTATVGGFDVVRQASQVRALIGLTGQYAAVDDLLSGRENLYMIARLSGLGRKRARARADELLEQFGLADAATQTVKNYSGGMRRRIDIAVSLVGSPRILFLDEPTTGLDPRSRGQLWDAIRARAAAGATVLLTTQYLEEADHLSGQIAVIDHGRVVASGTPDELKRRTGGQRLDVEPLDPGNVAVTASIISELAAAPAAAEPGSQTVSAPVTDPAVVPAVLRRLDEAGIAVGKIALRSPTLDEVFLTLTEPFAAAQGGSS
jgi:oleandomycin transport system ATP-binding protein